MRVSKTKLLWLPLLAVAIILSACAKPLYADGTYTHQSTEDSDGNYGVDVLTLKDQKIMDVDYKSYNHDGTLKDENYGKNKDKVIANKEFYQKAQFALSKVKDYQESLKNTGDIDMVDKISGATIIYDQFTECVEAILDEAATKYEESLKK